MDHLLAAIAYEASFREYVGPSFHLYDNTEYREAFLMERAELKGGMTMKLRDKIDQLRILAEKTSDDANLFLSGASARRLLDFTDKAITALEHYNTREYASLTHGDSFIQFAAEEVLAELDRKPDDEPRNSQHGPYHRTTRDI